ncbi:MAG: hypothetical protein JXK95_05275 [Bacteroidales bacterium]|nr:hypothetical protein [Bacteroidales bacterium]
MKKHYSHYLIIIGVCILAFYQIAFLLESLKWDNLDSYLPMRFYVSECLRNGIFPLWLPYQGLGTPIFGDLISTNYPLAVFSGRLLLYDNIVLHIFFMMYVVIAGLGMYRLAKQLKISPGIALIIAVAYAMSGFMVGNAQHLQYIISGAWIPLIIRYYLQLCSEKKISVLLKFIVVTYLQASGGYPAHTIFLAYLLAVFLIINIIRQVTLKKYGEVFAIIKVNLIAVFFLGILCFGIFLSIKQVSPFIDRYNGMSYEMSAYNPFTPACLISLISPLTPAVFPDVFSTDLSMNNLYFGIILLVLFIYGITRPLSHNSTVFLVVGIVALLIAFGSYFFLHRLAYEVLPLFKTFRHPGNLRLFTILSFLLVTGIQMTHCELTDKKNLIRFKHVLWIIIALIFLSALFSALMIFRNSTDSTQVNLSFLSLKRDYGLYGPLLVQLMLALVFLFLVYLSVFVNKKIPVLVCILVLVTAEMLIFTQMNASYTVYYAHSNPVDLQRHMRSQPRGFPLPDHHTVAENTESSIAYRQFVENSNTYAKTVSVEKCYPYFPDGYRKLMRDTALALASCNNNLIYRAEEIIPAGKRGTIDVNPASDSKIVFVDDTVYDQFDDLQNTPHITGDTVIFTRFSPFLIEAMVQSATSGLYVLLQNNFFGWKVYIDDKETDHFTVNHTLIGTILAPGKHLLRYEFRNPCYVRTTLFSFALFIILLYFLMALSIREQLKLPEKMPLPWMIAAVPAGILVFFLLKPWISYTEHKKSIDQTIVQILDSTLVRLSGESTYMILNTESSDPYAGINTSHGFIHKRFRLYTDMADIWNILDSLSADNVIYAWSNVLDLPETHDIIRLTYPELIARSTGDRYNVSVYSKTSGISEISESLSLNDFENPAPGWSYDRTFLDSTFVISGRYADKMTPAREFSSTFRFSVNQIPEEGLRVFSTMQYKQVGNNSCYLVITVNRNGKTLYYHAVDLNAFTTDKDEWNRAFTSQQYRKRNLKKGDEIVVYCWNSGKNEALYVDDFLVRTEYYGFVD